MVTQPELDIIESGRVTAPATVGTNTLNDFNKNWAANVHKNRQVRIVSGAGAGQFFPIESNNGKTLVIRGSWLAPLDTTSQYVILGVDFAQILRDVLGQGSDIGPTNPLEVHDPKTGSLISYEGITTADGAGDGSTLICSDLTTKPDYDGHWVVITSGDYAGQASDITGATTGGTVTAHEAFDGQITTGTKFVILAMKALPAEVAAIEAKLDHAAYGLAALKALIDAVETKLDDAATGLVAIVAEVDANEVKIDAIESKLDDGTTGLAALKTLVDAIEAKLDHATYGLSALKTEIDANETKIDAVDTVADSILSEVQNATYGLSAIKVLVDDLESRLTVARAAYLDELDFDLDGRLGTPAGASLAADIATIDTIVDAIKAVTDLLPDGGALNDLATLESRLTAARAALLDEITAARMEELDAANIPDDIDSLKTSRDRQLFSMDFWSDPMEEVQVAAAAGTLAITPTVTVADLPAGATIVRATAMFKFRMIENTYDGVNKLDGGTVAATSQVIQVKETAAGAYIDAINFVDDQFTLTALAREGGDVLIGSIDVSAQVDGNDSYTFQWLLAKADQDFINFNDVQVGLRIFYSV